MIEEEAHYTAFEAYRRQEMPARERRAFEQELAQDPALRQLYQGYLSWVEGIRDAKRQELKHKLQTWDAEMPPVVKKSSPIWRIAASIVLLITLSGTFFLYRTSQTSAFTPGKYLEEPGLPVMMGASHSWSPAMNAYRAGNYALALQQLPSSAGADTATYFKGVFTLKLRQPTVALAHFTSASLATSAYSAKASYYKAYALWQAGRKAEARKEFELIAQDPRQPFQKEAQAVLASAVL